MLDKIGWQRASLFPFQYQFPPVGIAPRSREWLVKNLFRLSRDLNISTGTNSTTVWRESATMRFIDIGVNLTDPVFRGIYRGKRRHAGRHDLEHVLQRATVAGVEKMIITAGSVTESEQALEIAKAHGNHTNHKSPCSSDPF
ncbi:hypothetical protein BC938DRAFT_478141 [Jimgerdemannia flammicorona]|uniref:TatD family n=1 Tax=Jimgerdemannia flammicorona TaxID=994334 RepID=A0A433QYK5_9FUNG|nr:hypothetical protein BC938DRAFT_478141 [Jimgerdemannia flammicorona]